MQTAHAWGYLNRFLRPDGWGCDGPFVTPEMTEAITTVERLVRTYGAIYDQTQSAKEGTQATTQGS